MVRRRRSGFTLLELLIVVLILGILAAIAITTFGATKRRAYLAAMQSDLRGVATAAESQFTSDDTYATTVTPQGSEGVTLTFVGTATGWQATATHASVPGVICSIASGSALSAGDSSGPHCE
ncbi:MAG: prepilin-type N-terminal cleavage/methylation domain-containing protein [Gemmatimonadota bacterium]|nr:prepilin-type N-terminal cleavage/methylation domain-containing protein [Gemmatimonadota bacterium]